MAAAEAILTLHQKKLRDLRKRFAGAVEQLDDADINWRPNEDSLSIGNILIHVHGNMSQRIGDWLGDEPFARDRDYEFNTREHVSKERALAMIAQVFDQADRIVGALDPARLTEVCPKAVDNMTVLDILYSVTTHISEHLGQVMYIAKARLGDRYRILVHPHNKQKT